MLPLLHTMGWAAASAVVEWAEAAAVDADAVDGKHKTEVLRCQEWMEQAPQDRDG